MKKYHFNITDPSNTAKAQFKNAKVSFKNTRETSRVLVGLQVNKAIKYLNQVMKKERCVPMRRYARGVGRTAQAKEFKTDKGRWPVKSCKFFIDLLVNLKANAKSKNMDEDSIYIENIIVNKARVIHGRLYRAYGRVNAFDSHPCHIQVIGKVKKENVPKLSEEEKIKSIQA